MDFPSKIVAKETLLSSSIIFERSGIDALGSLYEE